MSGSLLTSASHQADLKSPDSRLQSFRPTVNVDKIPAIAGNSLEAAVPENLPPGQQLSARLLLSLHRVTPINLLHDPLGPPDRIGNGASILWKMALTRTPDAFVPHRVLPSALQS